MQAALFKVDFGANQNDADGVELTDWDVIGTWTFDEFNNGNAQWNLTDFAGGADRDVTLTRNAEGLILVTIPPGESRFVFLPTAKVGGKQAP